MDRALRSPSVGPFVRSHARSCPDHPRRLVFERTHVQGCTGGGSSPGRGLTPTSRRTVDERESQRFTRTCSMVRGLGVRGRSSVLNLGRSVDAPSGFRPDLCPLVQVSSNALVSRITIRVVEVSSPGWEGGWSGRGRGSGSHVAVERPHLHPSCPSEHPCRLEDLSTPCRVGPEGFRRGRVLLLPRTRAHLRCRVTPCLPPVGDQGPSGADLVAATDRLLCPPVVSLLSEDVEVQYPLGYLLGHLMTPLRTPTPSVSPLPSEVRGGYRPCEWLQRPRTPVLVESQRRPGRPWTVRLPHHSSPGRERAVVGSGAGNRRVRRPPSSVYSSRVRVPDYRGPPGSLDVSSTRAGAAVDMSPLCERPRMEVPSLRVSAPGPPVRIASRQDPAGGREGRLYTWGRRPWGDQRA